MVGDMAALADGELSARLVGMRGFFVAGESSSESLEMEMTLSARPASSLVAGRFTGDPTSESLDSEITLRAAFERRY